MTCKNILLVSKAFYPENSPRSFRATELAKEYCRQGHNVTVVTIFRNYDYSGFLDQFKINLIFTDKVSLSEIDLKPKNRFTYLLNRLLIRLFLTLVEYPNVKLSYVFYKSLRKLNGEYDLLISFAVPYPVHWGVALFNPIKKKLTKTWAADCGDPFYLEKLDSFRKLFYFKWIEKWMFRKATIISITEKGFIQNYFKEFHSKIVIIPQGFNFSDVVLDKYTPNRIPTFAFAGGIGGKSRNPKWIMEALSNIHSDFKFIIYTSNKDSVESYKVHLKDKIFLRDPINRLELLRELSTMDFLVNIEYDPLNQSPSKLIDYSITGRPVLNFREKSRTFDTTVLEEFFLGNYQNRFILDIAKYDIKVVANQFLSLAD